MNLYGVVTGTDAYTLNVSVPAGFSLQVGDTVTVRPLNANTGASTLDIGLGAMPLTLNGAALTAGQLEAGKDRQCTFVGSGFALDNAGSTALTAALIRAVVTGTAGLGRVISDDGASGLVWAAIAGGFSLVCALRKSANQTPLSNSADTVITYDTEDVDTLGFHSTSSNTERCTIPSGQDGNYLAIDIIPADWLGPYNLTLTHRKNGTKVAGGGQQQFWSNESAYYVKTIVVITYIKDLVAGDYIDLVGYATSANCVIQGGSSVSARRYLLKG